MLEYISPDVAHASACRVGTPADAFVPIHGRIRTRNQLLHGLAWLPGHAAGRRAHLYLAGRGAYPERVLSKDPVPHLLQFGLGFVQ